MLQSDLIPRFLKCKAIAVVGVSRGGDIPANYILDKLIESGYLAFAINPNRTEVKGRQCYEDVTKVPVKVQGVILAGTPEVSEITIDHCKEAGVEIVWMHRGIGNGSYSAKAADLCKMQGIEVIENGCPMMFIQPVDPFHRFLRWLKKYF